MLIRITALVCVVVCMGGCERQYFRSHGVVSSDGGQLAAWSRPVQGCSPDPLDGQPVGKSATLFTLYWDNPRKRPDKGKHRPVRLPEPNQLQQLEISRDANGVTGLLRTSLINSDAVLDARSCSKLQATTAPGKPALQGGRPTVNGTLELDCHVADSHLTGSVRFSGCEY